MNNGDYNIIVLVLGVALLGIAYLPNFLEKKPLSYPIFYIGLGILLFKLPLNLDNPHPLLNKPLATHLTELCVIIALMGTGLRIDKPFSFKNWSVPLCLILITMVLSIVMLTFLGVYVNELSWASALLLGAALAPTDPVLASDIQVGPPGKGKEDMVRFSLTSEAGLNDGMAFPFVYLALHLLNHEKNIKDIMGSWIIFDLLYKIGIGILIGWIIGKFMGFVIFKLPKKNKILQPYDGFVSVAITLITYGSTELIKGYGFLAVFITAVVFRNYERDHHYHSDLHNFSEQFEKLFILILLILFGGSIAHGLLAKLNLNGILYALLSILIIRPLCGMLGMLKSPANRKEKIIISFFGIKGIGSFFYLSFALNQEIFPDQEELWSILGFTVLLSVILHGITASFAIRKIEEDLPEKQV